MLPLKTRQPLLPYSRSLYFHIMAVESLNNVEHDQYYHIIKVRIPKDHG